jgi:hypothetical protein
MKSRGFAAAAVFQLYRSDFDTIASRTPTIRRGPRRIGIDWVAQEKEKHSLRDFGETAVRRSFCF